MRRQYPYFIVKTAVGRLAAPIQYKHTPIAKMFKSGKIGGRKVEETVFYDEDEARTRAITERRFGKEVEVFKIERPNMFRRKIF